MDYYSEARRLGELLKSEGLLAESAKIDEVIEQGATGTEIMMGIRFHLEQAVPKASPATRAEIGALLSTITSALK